MRDGYRQFVSRQSIKVKTPPSYVLLKFGIDFHIFIYGSFPEYSESGTKEGYRQSVCRQSISHDLSAGLCPDMEQGRPEVGLRPCSGSGVAAAPHNHYGRTGPEVFVGEADFSIVSITCWSDSYIQFYGINCLAGLISLAISTVLTVLV